MTTVKLTWKNRRGTIESRTVESGDDGLSLAMWVKDMLARGAVWVTWEPQS